MRGLLGFLALTSMVAGVTDQVQAQAQVRTYEVTTRTDVEYVEHDGVKLTGDLYLSIRTRRPGHASC